MNALFEVDFLHIIQNKNKAVSETKWKLFKNTE